MLQNTKINLKGERIKKRKLTKKANQGVVYVVRVTIVMSKSALGVSNRRHLIIKKKK